MDKMLKEFELIVTLKSEIFRVNLNFLCKQDLENIEYLSYDLGIQEYLSEYDIEGLYDFQFEEVQEIYDQWCSDILDAFNHISSKLNGRLN